MGNRPKLRFFELAKSPIHGKQSSKPGLITGGYIDVQYIYMYIDVYIYIYHIYIYNGVVQWGCIRKSFWINYDDLTSWRVVTSRRNDDQDSGNHPHSWLWEQLFSGCWTIVAQPYVWIYVYNGIEWRRMGCDWDILWYVYI